MKKTDEEIKQDHYYDEPEAAPDPMSDYYYDDTWNGRYGAARNSFYELLSRVVHLFVTVRLFPYLLTYFGAFSLGTLIYGSPLNGIVAMFLWFVVSFCFIQPGRG